MRHLSIDQLNDIKSVHQFKGEIKITKIFNCVKQMMDICMWGSNCRDADAVKETQWKRCIHSSLEWMQLSEKKKRIG